MLVSNQEQCEHDGMSLTGFEMYMNGFRAGCPELPLRASRAAGGPKEQLSKRAHSLFSYINQACKVALKFNEKCDNFAEMETKNFCGTNMMMSQLLIHCSCRMTIHQFSLPHLIL